MTCGASSMQAMPVVYLDSQTSCFKSTHLPYFPRVTDLEPLILRKTRDMLKMEGVWPYIVLVHIPTLGQSATEMLKGSCSFVKWTRNTAEVPSPNETEFFKHSIWHTTGSKDDDCYSLNHWSSLQVGPAQREMLRHTNFQAATQEHCTSLSYSLTFDNRAL